MSFLRLHVRMIILGVIGLLVIFVTPDVAMRIAVSPFIYRIDTAPHVQAAIVLGASVVDGMQSTVLAERSATALSLWQSGVVPKILASGDNGSVTYDEVTPIKNYLLTNDVPAQDIFLDHAGFDTYSSMYRASAIFDITSAIVVTQDFHMPRALFLARSVGIDAYGVVAPSGGNEFFEYVREIPAAWKAIFDVATHRTPQYLGEPIPIWGNGEASW